jgi:uncharacterized protein YwqG
VPAADYAQAIAASKLPRKEAILALIRTGYALRTARSPRPGPPVGRSRLGGRLDLPPGFEWPAWKGKSQAFVAQIDLDDFRTGRPSERDLLPASGRLHFFYDQDQGTWGFDPNDRGSFGVYYSDVPASALEPADLPDDIEAGSDRSLDVVAFEPIQTVPKFDSPAFEQIGLSDADVTRYLDLIPKTEVAAGLVEGDDEQGITSLVEFHQMLGNARAVQASMERECEMVRVGLYCGDSRAYGDPRAEGAKARWADWLLLLQLDSDEALDWCWGDVGRIYFRDRHEDLRARRFDQSWLILQCS